MSFTPKMKEKGIQPSDLSGFLKSRILDHWKLHSRCLTRQLNVVLLMFLYIIIFCYGSLERAR